MAKLLGPDFISLQVRNLAASRTFYTELLGLTIDERFNAPDFVLFDTNSIPFALSEANVNLNKAPQPGWGMTLWIDCDRSMSCMPNWKRLASRSSRHPTMVRLGVPSSLLTLMGTGSRPMRTPGIVSL